MPTLPMRLRSELAAIAGYLLLAVGVTWPLPEHLTTHLPGAPGGDTGVYVWNLWIFRHELLRHRHFPLYTDHIFAMTNGMDLSAHNYTIFADLLGLPLIPVLGIVGAFNVIYLVFVAATGYATFLVIRRLTGATLEAWLGGAMFAASPVLIARGSAHYSLVAAMPLPLFLLCLLRMLETRRMRDALIAGAVAGWAGYCDVYFPIYCALMAAIVVAEKRWRVVRRTSGRRHALAGILTASIVGLSALIAWRLWIGHTGFAIFGIDVSFRSLYTPMLVLTVLVLARLQSAWRLSIVIRDGAPALRPLLRLGAAVVSSAALALSPILIALGRRMLDGRFPRTPIYWRSSPTGLDLLELVMPNPNHPWFGERMREWITAPRPDAFPEHVGSLSIVGVLLVLVTMWRLRGAIPKLWITFTAAFTLLALGPFVQVGRVNTFVPGPWALLRYVPVIDLARAPSRFVIVAALGLSICVAFALAGIRRGGTRHWRPVFGWTVALLAFELLPTPRVVFDAAVPTVYATIRADADESHLVLELPAGVRDGTSSIGDFNASAQYYQTVHQKPLIGGYVSRVSDGRKSRYEAMPVMSALFAMSAGAPVSDDEKRHILSAERDFATRSCITYVVIDRARTTAELRSFVIELLDLKAVGQDRGRELFEPSDGTRSAHCGPARSRP